MGEWKAYVGGAGSTVIGDVRVWSGLDSPQLRNRRDVLVWLPPGYDASDERYPTLYMHDGQNLFDAATSYAGEWQVDETMLTFAEQGIRAIVVGLPNAGERRRIEYSPYIHEIAGKTERGEGDGYIRFLVETVKPLIDQSFRTLPEADATGIVGSSMGGLISLYGFLTRPGVFGLCGAFSTAFWFGEGRLLHDIETLALGHGRVYLDVGTREGDTLASFQTASEDFNRMYRDGVRLLRDALRSRGYVEGDTLLYVEEEGAFHNEAAWARRLPDALRFLLQAHSGSK